MIIYMELEYLFSPKKIGNVNIMNRIVRSATHERSSEKYGYVGDAHIKIYTDLAEGGVGLIITGFTAVDPSGHGSPFQVALFDDSFTAGQKKLVNAVHEYSDVKIATQLGHTGRLGKHAKYRPVAPSPVYAKSTKLTPRELKTEEIKELIKKFVEAGCRAYECGYDMIQLHGAHGYFLSNFVSPFSNKRTDEFGGSVENKSRIFVDIYNGIRDKVGKKFPIMVKLQTQDFIPEGLELEEAIEIVKILVDAGFDAIEPSGGGAEAMGARMQYPSLVVKKPEDENYFLPTAIKMKPHMKNSALILIGGIKNPLSAEKILKEKNADFIAMSRPLIYEPDLPNRWKNGDLSPAKCRSCNSCYWVMMSDPLYCVVKKKRLRREQKLRQKEENN